MSKFYWAGILGIIASDGLMFMPLNIHQTICAVSGLFLYGLMYIAEQFYSRSSDMHFQINNHLPEVTIGAIKASVEAHVKDLQRRNRISGLQ